MRALLPKDSTQIGKLWDRLSEEEKNEVMLSYEESEDDDNLLSAEGLLKKK